MKITAHACLESMMFEALNELKKARKELDNAYIALMQSKNNDTQVRYCEASIAVENADKRYSELLTARKIIKEMEAKGIEI